MNVNYKNIFENDDPSEIDFLGIYENTAHRIFSMMIRRYPSKVVNKYFETYIPTYETIKKIVLTIEYNLNKGNDTHELKKLLIDIISKYKMRKNRYHNLYRLFIKHKLLYMIPILKMFGITISDPSSLLNMYDNKEDNDDLEEILKMIGYTNLVVKQKINMDITNENIVTNIDKMSKTELRTLKKNVIKTGNFKVAIELIKKGGIKNDKDLCKIFTKKEKKIRNRRRWYYERKKYGLERISLKTNEDIIANMIDTFREIYGCINKKKQILITNCIRNNLHTIAISLFKLYNCDYVDPKWLKRFKGDLNKFKQLIENKIISIEMIHKKQNIITNFILNNRFDIVKYMMKTYHVKIPLNIHERFKYKKIDKLFNFLEEVNFPFKLIKNVPEAVLRSKSRDLLHIYMNKYGIKINNKKKIMWRFPSIYYSLWLKHKSNDGIIKFINKLYHTEYTEPSMGHHRMINILKVIMQHRKNIQFSNEIIMYGINHCTPIFQLLLKYDITILDKVNLNNVMITWLNDPNSHVIHTLICIEEICGPDKFKDYFNFDNVANHKKIDLFNLLWVRYDNMSRKIFDILCIKINNEFISDLLSRDDIPVATWTLIMKHINTNISEYDIKRILKKIIMSRYCGLYDFLFSFYKQIKKQNLNIKDFIDVHFLNTIMINTIYDLDSVIKFLIKGCEVKPTQLTLKIFLIALSYNMIYCSCNEIKLIMEHSNTIDKETYDLIKEKLNYSHRYDRNGNIYKFIMDQKPNIVDKIEFNEDDDKTILDELMAIVMNFNAENVAINKVDELDQAIMEANIEEQLT